MTLQANLNKMKGKCVCKEKMKTYSKRMKSFIKINTFYFILNWGKKGRKMLVVKKHN